jgi:hypothetical protein
MENGCQLKMENENNSQLSTLNSPLLKQNGKLIRENEK